MSWRKLYSRERELEELMLLLLMTISQEPTKLEEDLILKLARLCQPL